MESQAQAGRVRVCVRHFTHQSLTYLQQVSLCLFFENRAWTNEHLDGWMDDIGKLHGDQIPAGRISVLTLPYMHSIYCERKPGHTHTHTHTHTHVAQRAWKEPRHQGSLTHSLTRQSHHQHLAAQDIRYPIHCFL